MKLQHTTKDGRMTVEIEGETQAEVWRQLASFQEVFEDNTVKRDGEVDDCIRYVVRTVGDDEYFEKQYCGNNSKLFGVKKSYGQMKKEKGRLFPKNKDKDGNYYQNNGWVKYDKESGTTS
jgi:hypothetical protein